MAASRPSEFATISLKGSAVLDEFGPRLDELFSACDVPITARRPWLETWIGCYSDRTPLAVLLSDRERLHGAALLALGRRGLVTEITGLGHYMSDFARFAARNDAAAGALAAATAQAVDRVRRPWDLRVEQLPEGDPVVAALAGHLHRARTVPGEGGPRLVFGAERALGSYLSGSARQNRRTALNRARTDGFPVSTQCIRDPSSIRLALPEMERVRRLRDVQLRGRSMLDHPQAGRFWRSIIPTLAASGEVEVVVVRFSDRLVAYVVGLLDRDSYRMWDTRFDPEFSRYSPGRLAEIASLESALSDDRFTQYDWMRGVEPYKLQTAREVVPSETLVALSSRAQATLADLRHSAGRFAHRHRVLNRARAAVRRRRSSRGGV